MGRWLEEDSWACSVGVWGGTDGGAGCWADNERGAACASMGGRELLEDDGGGNEGAPAASDGDGGSLLVPESPAVSEVASLVAGAAVTCPSAMLPEPRNDVAA